MKHLEEKISKLEENEFVVNDIASGSNNLEENAEEAVKTELTIVKVDYLQKAKKIQNKALKFCF